MKQIIAILALFTAFQAQAQKVVNKAIVTMKTEMEFPEQTQQVGGDDGGNFRMMPRDMELTSTIFFKEDQTKVETSSDFGKNYTFIDRKAKKTTTLMEVMGRKQGFWSSDEDQANMQKRMDSIRAARADSLKQLGITFAPPSEPEITYTEEKKKIAGYECKKAIIKTKSQRGELNETAVWYTPEFKMADGFSLTTQGGGGMRMMGFNPAGIEKINGFPMEYEIVRQNGMRVHMTVTKVQLDPNIDDKTFEIPKGYDIKPMSEMQGPGGGMRIRMGGGGN